MRTTQSKFDLGQSHRGRAGDISRVRVCRGRPWSPAARLRGKRLRGMNFDQFAPPADTPARPPAPASGRDDDAATPDGGRPLQFAPRSLIFLEGDAADAVFPIVSGAAMLYKLLPDGRRQIVEILGTGDVFGFSPKATHDVSAETLTAVRCIAFDRSAIECSPSLMSRLSARLY